MNSVTRLGDFWKILLTNFKTKVVHKRLPFLGYNVKSLYCLKLLWLLFGHLWKHLGYFLLQHLVTLFRKEIGRSPRWPLTCTDVELWSYLRRTLS